MTLGYFDDENGLEFYCPYCGEYTLVTTESGVSPEFSWVCEYCSTEWFLDYKEEE